MAALDFPDNPAVGDLYGSAGTVWRWDGARWASTAGASGARGRVGFAYITANIGGYGASSVDIYGLAVSFPAVAGRTYKLTGHVYLGGANANSVGNAIITDAAGNQLQGAIVSMPSPGVPFKSHSELVVVAQATGVLSYKMQANLTSGGGAMTVYASPQYPAFLLVEDITFEAGSSGQPPSRTLIYSADLTNSYANANGVVIDLSALRLAAATLTGQARIDIAGRMGFSANGQAYTMVAVVPDAPLIAGSDQTMSAQQTTPAAGVNQWLPIIPMSLWTPIAAGVKPKLTFQVFAGVPASTWWVALRMTVTEYGP